MYIHTDMYREREKNIFLKKAYIYKNNIYLYMIYAYIILVIYRDNIYILYNINKYINIYNIYVM